MKRSLLLLAVTILCLAAAGAETHAARHVLSAKSDGKLVPPAVMETIHEQIKTPYKYGIILRDGNGKMVDSPSVFRHGDRWYMVYITFNGDGYETEIAVSGNLLDWKPLGGILPFRKGTWDAAQAAGYIAIQDHTWGGSYRLEPYGGKYWMSYLGGNLKGYETDPLMIGIAHTSDPTQAKPWTRLEEPVISRDQPDCRAWEKTTQFKSHIIHDHDKSLGYPFVMYYNARTQKGHERIGMAVSNDMTEWLRYGVDPVIDHGKGIAGDPQITRIGNVWVMFYFGAFYQPGAFDTFACSYDLVRWTKWEGNPLVEPSEPWDRKYAHKPWVIFHDGIVYHFYCAVGSEGRVIAVATSKDLTKPKEP